MTTMAQADFAVAHLSAAMRSAERYAATEARADAKKAVNHGVRAAILHARNKRADPEALFQLFELVRGCIAILTPNELMQVFPIDKTYDGARWEEKDYFYTMDVLRQHGLDTPIGGSVDDLLWDYMNITTRIFTVEYTSVASRIYRSMTGEGILERFCQANGIDYYTRHTDEAGREHLISAQTGEMHRAYPSYLKLLPGGARKED